ncbi:uncharacterized protein LOC133395654 isoform X2 [Phycodurus eques]|uniref:uncharacterized protein LOC133395654 isoform X2 n=1 Tax=Phycodurus eques TaxID=693459 RepID=UPI002ACD4D73|nr:uncharacterized protein LOC133395654 isoform X2 [Phycodurus eques]
MTVNTNTLAEQIYLELYTSKNNTLSLIPLSDRLQSNMSSVLKTQEDRVVELNEWEQRWEENKIGFHQPQVHRMLESKLDKVLAGRKEVRFFFPLCGKAVDMKWLADMGHSVVGVEISEIAIQQFFVENNLSYSEEPVLGLPGAKIFKPRLVKKKKKKKKAQHQGDQNTDAHKEDQPTTWPVMCGISSHVFGFHFGSFCSKYSKYSVKWITNGDLSDSQVSKRMWPRDHIYTVPE